MNDKVIKVNDKFINIFKEDDINTILIKIAVSMDTLVKFLYFLNITNKEDIKNADDFEILNLIDVIKNETDINNLVEVLPKYWPDVSKSEYLKLWLSLRPDLTKDIHYIFIINDFAEKHNIIASYIGIDEDYSHFYNEIMDNEINNMKLKISKSVLLHDSQHKVSKKVNYTEFIKDEEFYKLCIHNNNDLFDMFNNIILNNRVLFATYNDYFKLYKNFIPVDDWIESYNDFIVIYIYIMSNMDKLDSINNLELDNEKKILLINNMFSIVFVKKVDDNMLDIEFGINLSQNTLSKEQIQTIILESLQISNIIDTPNTSNTINQITTHISGLYFIPNVCIDLFILSDMIYTDPFIRKYITVDEMNTIKVNNTRLFGYFKNPENDAINLKFSATTKKVDKLDKDYKFMDKKIFKNGEYYLRLRLLKVKDISTIKSFQQTMSKLLEYYIVNFSKVVLYYKEYIPTFTYIHNEEKTEHKKLSKIKELQSIDPIMFGYNYARKCPKHRFPTLLGPADSTQNDNPKVFKFPKDGDVSFNFTCDSTEFPWFGLVENENLKGLSPHMLVPCCFNTQQDNRKITHTYKYYFDQTEESEKEKGKHIFTTNKILPYGRIGYLPPYISSILNILDQNNQYVRLGVMHTPSSFLNCILETMDPKFFNITDKKDKISYLHDVRLNISKAFDTLNLCKQECYGMDNDEIRNILEDTTKYLDPMLFIELLKEYFGCDIYLFTSDITNPNGRIQLPRYTNGYYYDNTCKNTVIFIYFHNGSEVDNVDYPLCELIVNINIGKGWDLFRSNYIVHNSHNNICTSHVFQSIFLYSVSKHYSPTLHNNFISINKKLLKYFKCQYIDNYGKCRGLIITKMKNSITGNNYMFITTMPMKPFNLPSISQRGFIITDLLQEKYSMSDIDNLISKFEKYDPENKIKIISVYKNGNITEEVKISYKDIIMSINSDIRSERFNTIQLNNKDSINMTSNINVIYDKFVYNEKMSRVLLHTTIFLFSRYLSNELIDFKNAKDGKFKNNTLRSLTYMTRILNTKQYDELDHVIKLFVDKNMILNEKRKIYVDDIPVRTILNNTFLFDNHKKLVIPDITLFNNLLYHLKIKIIEDIRYVFAYYKRTTLDEFYTVVSDFTSIKYNLILKGKNNVINNLKIAKNQMYINDSILLIYKVPYFFFNKFIHQYPVILINFDSIERAVQSCIDWNTKYHNNDINNNIMNLKYTLYKFNNKDSIEIEIINGEENILDIKIIKYTLYGNIFFCALLDISYAELPKHTSLIKSDIYIQIEKLNINSEVQKIFYVPIINEECDVKNIQKLVRGPSFYNKSCYIDAMFVALFYKENKYISDSFLTRKLEDIFIDRPKNIKLSIHPELFSIVRNIQSNLCLLTTNLRDPTTMYTCNNLRQNLHKYQNTFNCLYGVKIKVYNWIEQIDETQISYMISPVDIMKRLYFIFRPEQSLKYIEREFGINDKGANGPELVLIRYTTDTPTYPSINLNTNTDYYSSLYYTIDNILNKLIYEVNYPNNKSLKHKGISYTNTYKNIIYVACSNFFHIHVSSRDLDKNQYYVPAESIKLNNDLTPLVLTTIIIKIEDYECMMRCENGMWFLYNSIKGISDKLYSFDTLKHDKYIINHITDLIYMS